MCVGVCVQVHGYEKEGFIYIVECAHAYSLPWVLFHVSQAYKMGAKIDFSVILPVGSVAAKKN